MIPIKSCTKMGINQDDFYSILLLIEKLCNIDFSPFKNAKKQDSRLTVLPMLALPIFPGRLQPSIVGRIELNFRVRDGNGWTLNLINTNYLLHCTLKTEQRYFG